MTSVAIRCSAWFGCIKFGFLVPEILIRKASAPICINSPSHLIPGEEVKEAFP